MAILGFILAGDVEFGILTDGRNILSMIYVDEIIDWGDIARAKGLKWTHWCHMIADTHQELMEMAMKLKLKPEWIEQPGTPDEHFDLIPSKRTRAIKQGAKAISCVELGEMIIKRRYG